MVVFLHTFTRNALSSRLTISLIRQMLHSELPKPVMSMCKMAMTFLSERLYWSANFARPSDTDLIQKSHERYCCLRLNSIAISALGLRPQVG